MEEAEILCDRIAIMDYGKIIAMGTPEELLAEHCRGSAVILQKGIREDILEKLPWKYFQKQDRVEIQTDNLNECIQSVGKGKNAILDTRCSMRDKIRGDLTNPASRIKDHEPGSLDST